MPKKSASKKAPMYALDASGNNGYNSTTLYEQAQAARAAYREAHKHELKQFAPEQVIGSKAYKAAQAAKAAKE